MDPTLPPSVIYFDIEEFDIESSGLRVRPIILEDFFMGTHYQGTDEERRVLDAYIKLMRATSTVTNRLAARLRRRGLTTSQLGVLEALWHLGEMDQRTLAGKLLSSQGNLTTVLDNLERRGLVQRRRDTKDRRRSWVRLTKRGREVIGEVFPAHVAAIREEFSVLTPEEQEELARLCRKLGLGGGN